MSATTLQAGLGLRRGDIVSLVGAGGKTSLAYRLAAEAHASGWRVVVSATTHMGPLSDGVAGPVILEEEDGEGAVESALARQGRATVLARRLRADKLRGVAPERVAALARLADLVVVEADGARGRSLKVPAPHEPVMPSCSTLVVVLAGLDVLDCPLDESVVHRLEHVSAATAGGGPRVTEEIVAAALRHPGGYLARLPTGARVVAFLNKVEDARREVAAQRLARRLLPAYDVVASGSLRDGAWRFWPRPEQDVPVAGIVLSAGASRRMGRPKVLLPWQGRTLLAACVLPLLAAGLDPVVVVLGCEAQRVSAGAELPRDARLHLVVNEAWADGLSSSLQAGLRASRGAPAAVVALADQPGIQPAVIRRLTAAHAQGARLALVVEEGRPGHPVLFDRSLWGELEHLRGDVGGRDVVRAHWDEAVRIEAPVPPDVDTREDYEALLGQAGRSG